MSWILLVYLILPNEKRLVHTAGGYSSKSACYKASKSFAIAGGPGQLAFECLVSK